MEKFSITSTVISEEDKNSEMSAVKCFGTNSLRMKNLIVTTEVINGAIHILTKKSLFCMMTRYRSYSNKSSLLSQVMMRSGMEAGFMSERFSLNLEDYAAIIDSHFENHDVKAVRRVYSEMRDNGVSPDLATMNTMIKACTKAGDIAGAEAILLELVSVGVKPDILTLTIMIDAYAMKGDSVSAEVVFSEMLSIEKRPNRGVMLSLINSYVMSADPLGCENAFKRMRSMGLENDDVVMNAIINCYARKGDANGAAKTFITMELRGVKPNEVTMNTIVNAYIKMGDIIAAESSAVKMRRYGLVPSKITRNTIITAYMNKKDIINASRCIHAMHESGIIPDKILLDSFINVCGKEKNTVEAQNTVDFMKAIDIEVDQITMNALLLAYANAGDIDGVERVTSEMMRLDMGLNKYSSANLLKAYAQCGDSEGTRRELDSLRNSGVEIVLPFINILLSSFISPSGNVNWDGMLKCYEEFFTSGLYVANDYTYNHFLMACKRSMRKDDAEYWFQKVVVLNDYPSNYSVRVFRQTVGDARFSIYCSHQTAENRKKIERITGYRMKALEDNSNGLNNVRRWAPSGKRWTPAVGFEQRPVSVVW